MDERIFVYPGTDTEKLKQVWNAKTNEEMLEFCEYVKERKRKLNDELILELLNEEA